MKIGGVIFVAVIALIVGAVGTHIVRERSIAKQDAEIAALRAELDSMLVVVERDSILADSLEERHKTVSDSLREVIKDAEGEAIDAQVEADSLGKALRNSLSPTLRPALDALIAVHQRERQAYRVQLAALEARVAEDDSLLAFYRESNATLRTALRSSEVLTDYWREKAKRSPWEKPWFSAATAVGGAGLAVLAFK